MFEVKFYIGIERDLNGNPISGSIARETQQAAEELLIRLYGGFTNFTGSGSDSSNANKTLEVTNVYVVVTPEEFAEENIRVDNEAQVLRNAGYTAESLKALCRQRSVLYTVSKVSGGFV